MGIGKIRKEVRYILKELSHQFHSDYYINSGSGNQFPKANDDGFVALPQNINTSQDYLINWNGYSNNHDLYNFPLEEFKKGISVEKSKRSNFNILEISKIVIDNLKENPNFYSNLGV